MDAHQSQWKLLGLPLALSFLLICVYGLSVIYADALFLSTYPRSWLTYSFMALPFIWLFVSFVISPFLIKATNKQSFLFILSMSAILMLMHELLLTGIYVMPFIFTLLITIFVNLIGILGSNTIAAAFDMQVFKRHVFKFNMFGRIGAVSTAFFTPVIIYFFHSSGVFYALIISMIVMAICILKIQQLPVPVSQRVEQDNITLNKQSFFRALFCIVIVAAMIRSLSDFAFKAILIGQFSQDDLAMFISIYSGAVSLCCLFIQFFLAASLLLRIGLMGMLLIPPILCLGMGFGISIWPIFPLFVLMRAAYSIGVICFKDPGQEMIINPFPSALRKKISFVLKGHGNAISGFMGALLVMIVNAYLPLNFIGIIIVLFSLIWIFFTFKVGRGYQETLFKALKENRYNPDLLNFTPESVRFLHDDILKALNSQDLHIVRAGLNFFDNETFLKFSPAEGLAQALIQKLSDPEKDIRYKAVVALKQLNISHSSDALRSQFEVETAQDVGLAVMEALLHFDVLPNRQDIARYLESDLSFKHAYAMIALDRLTDEQSSGKLHQEITRLMQGNTQERLTVAIAQNYMKSSAQQVPCLMQLLQDESVDVSIQAIHALKPGHSTQFIAILINMLNHKTKSYSAEWRLASYQDSILETLQEVELNTAFRQRQSMIRLLARLNNPLALDKLIELSMSSDLELRLFIANQVLRFANAKVSDALMKQKIVNMLIWSADEICCLLALDAANDPGVLLEINLQLHMNRCVFVAWFSLLSDKFQVAAVAHYVESPEHYHNIEQAKAYELFDHLSTDINVRQAVNRIALDYLRDKPIHHDAGINPGIVMLATNPFKYQKGSPMNNMDKSALLRRVKLFEGVPVQSLLVIAAVTRERDMFAGEVIFKDHDEANQFYCIASGQVCIKKGETVLSELAEADYFGELGLLDNMPRTADAIAQTDGALLYIEKQDFVNVLEDLPQIMHAVMGQMIKYLRQNLERETKKR